MKYISNSSSKYEIIWPRAVNAQFDVINNIEITVAINESTILFFCFNKILNSENAVKHAISITKA